MEKKSNDTADEKKTFTVLIADDDTSLLEAMCRRMRNEDFNLIIAQDGYQAVQLARKHEPDVAVLDIKMPAGDGFTVVERIHALPILSDLPVIYITGERSDETMDRAKKIGAHALLYKPFDSSALIDVIKEAIDA